MSMTKCKIALASLVVGALTLLAFGLPAPVPTERAVAAQQTKPVPPVAGQQKDLPASGSAPRLFEPEQGEQVLAVKYCSTGEWMVTAEMSGRVRLWNTRTQRPGPVLPGPERMVRSVVFTPDGKTVVAGCDDGKIYVWDVPAGKLRTTLKGHRGSVFAVALASDGKTLASFGGPLSRGDPVRWELKIWDLIRAKHVRDIECTDNSSGTASCSMVFAPGTNLLAVACQGPFRGIKVWNTVTGKEDRRFTYEEGFPLALAISPDGKWLVSGGGGVSLQERMVGTLKIWDWKSGKLERTLEDKTDGYFRAVAFSRDGTRLFAGCPGPGVTRNSLNCTLNVVYCWEARHWTRLWATQGLYGPVWALDVSPDGQNMTSSDSCGTSLLDTCLGRVKGRWLTTLHNVHVEEFGASRVLERPDWPAGLVNVIDVNSRVYALWVNGTETFFYRGKAPDVNEAIRKYAAVKGGSRHLVVLPGPGYTETRSGKPVVFDWQIQAPGGLDKPLFGRKDAMMAVYISATKPRPVNRRKVDQWLKDLDSDVYRTRETAAAELRKLGNDAKPALRAARAALPTLEARRRIDSLLDRLPSFDLTDLEIPKGIVVIDASDLIAKGLKALHDPDRHVRIGAAGELSGLARFGDKVVPALVAVLERDKDMHVRQVAASCLTNIGLPARSAAAALKFAEQERTRREQAIAREIRAWKNAKAAGHDAKVAD